MMKRQTGGEAIVGSLLRHGVEKVFAIPGVQTYGLFDALHQAGERIAVFGARHEQTTAYMAFGYAKSTGRPGVFSVVPGPGVLNTAAAIASAHGASAPILCLTGQVPSDFIGSGKGHLHELPDQLATLRSITKWADRISHPSQVPQQMDEAFRRMTGGRPRPVALEMPWEVFSTSALVEAGEAPEPPAVPQADPDLVEAAARLLKDARNPMIMVGSGAQHAADEVRSLAELLQAPVVSWRGGRGIVADDHPLGFTCAAGSRRWAETDVLIGIGSRLELQWFRWPTLNKAMRIINIDIDPEQMPRIGPAVGIVGDAAATTRALAEAVGRSGRRANARRDDFEAVKRRVASEIDKVQPYVGYLRAIREVLPRDGFLVEEICQAGFASYFGFPVYTPRSFVTCGHQGTLGFGFPTALGVKVGNPGKAVVSLAGDGGFMFGVQELATAVQYGINVVSVVFNNNAFGNVLRDQQQRFGGREIGSRLHNPDFVKLAESFGVAGYRARSPAELRRTLERALGLDAPALIEVPVDHASEVSPWEFLMPPAGALA